MSKISFISSGDRKYIISRTLSLIKSDILALLKGKERVVVKPYCFYSSDQLSSTYVEALDAVLEFIAPHIKSQIILAEGTAIGKTLDSFKNYDYFKLQDIYDFAIVDLNDDKMDTLALDNGSEIKVPTTLSDADFIISVAPPRYDARTTFAGAAVNLLEPVFRLNDSAVKKLAKRFSLLKRESDAKREFFTPDEINSIMKKLPLRLSVIDAYSIKKGVSSAHLNTPHWASSSTDFIANDALACQLLGVPYDQVEYLKLLTDDIAENGTVVVGDDWQKHILKLPPGL